MNEAKEKIGAVAAGHRHYGKMSVTALLVAALFVVAAGCSKNVQSGKKRTADGAGTSRNTEEEQIEDVALPPGRPDYQLLEYTEIGDLRCVKFLIVKRKAQVNGAVYKNNRETALHIALRNKFNDIATYLIDKGADVDALDANGTPPIAYPMANRDYKMMDFLLSKGAKKILIAVPYAVGDNDPKLLKYLLDKDFEPNVILNTDSRQSALHLAVEKNSPAMVKILLEHRAEVNAANKNGETPLHVAVKGTLSPEIAGLLLQYKADVNAVDKVRNTPLHLAVRAFSKNDYSDYIKYSPRSQSAAYTRLLLAANANVNAQNAGGATPLRLAGNVDVIDQLLRKNAVAPKDQNDDRLHWLFTGESGKKNIATGELVEALIKAGANPNYYHSGYMRSVLKAAVQYGNAPAAAVIIKHCGFAKGDPMHDTGVAEDMDKMPDLVKAMIDKGKHLNAAELRFLPLPLTKYYLTKNIGGGLNHEELEALLENLKRESGAALDPIRDEMDEKFAKYCAANGWNELIEKSVTNLSWENIFTLTFNKNYVLATALMPKFAAPETRIDSGSSYHAINAVMSSRNDDLIYALVMTKQVPGAQIEFWKIILQKKYALLEKLVSLGFDLNIRNKNNPLIAAIDQGDVKAAKILLDGGVDPGTILDSTEYRSVDEISLSHTGHTHHRLNCNYSVLEYAIAKKSDHLATAEEKAARAEIARLCQSRLPKNFLATRELYAVLNEAVYANFHSSFEQWRNEVDRLLRAGADMNIPENKDVWKKIIENWGGYEEFQRWVRTLNSQFPR